MARFNLADYETVESRIKRFYEENPDGRIITENLTTDLDRTVSTWVVRAEIYLSAGDQATGLPKATGMAFEIDGGAGANQTAALENAETSAIGRALANGGWSGSKRSSREEMAKAERGVAPQHPSVAPRRDYLAEASKLTDIEALRSLWLEAKTGKASQDVLAKIKELADVRGADALGSGAKGGISGSGKDGSK
jgi:hypothetical protein